MIPLTKGVIPNIQIHTNIPIYKSRWTYLYICEHLYIRDHSNSMKVTDVIFALICGRVIGFLVGDFLKEWGIEVGLAYSLVLWVLFPFASLLLLWIAQIIGRKLLFVYQAAKHLLVGAFATVIDLKFFEYLLLFVMANSLVVKAISFLFSTIIKYWGNKYWAFGRHVTAAGGIPPEGGKKDNIKKEMFQFFIITLVGLVIDVGVFYYATKIAEPQFGFPMVIWTKLAVIFAALAAAVWNFIGYKFLVFKK